MLNDLRYPNLPSEKVSLRSEKKALHRLPHPLALLVLGPLVLLGPGAEHRAHLRIRGGAKCAMAAVVLPAGPGAVNQGKIVL